MDKSDPPRRSTRAEAMRSAAIRSRSTSCSGRRSEPKNQSAFLLAPTSVANDSVVAANQKFSAPPSTANVTTSQLTSILQTNANTSPSTIGVIPQSNVNSTIVSNETNVSNDAINRSIVSFTANATAALPMDLEFQSNENQNAITAMATDESLNSVELSSSNLASGLQPNTTEVQSTVATCWGAIPRPNNRSTFTTATDPLSSASSTVYTHWGTNDNTVMNNGTSLHRAMENFSRTFGDVAGHEPNTALLQTAGANRQNFQLRPPSLVHHVASKQTGVNETVQSTSQMTSCMNSLDMNHCLIC